MLRMIYRKGAVLFFLFACLIQCHTSPARKIENDNSTYIEDTIKEVETLIKANPSLPRLTRGEIIDILDNLTKTDDEKTNQTRNEKAIMVVLPYSSKNVKDENLEELYRKAPITKLVDEGENKIDGNRVKTTTTTTTTEKITTTNDDFVYKFKPIRNKTTIKPKIEIETQKPLIKATFKPLRFQAAVKSTIKRFPNHKYPDENITTQKATTTPRLITTSRPITTSRTIITSRPITTPRPITTLRPITTTTLRNFVTLRNNALKITNPPNIKQTTKLPEVDELPDDFKHVLKNLDSLIKEDPDYSNHYETLAMKLPNENDNIKDILDSINKLPTTTDTPGIVDMANNLTPEMKDLLMTFGLIPNDKIKEAIPATTENSYFMEPHSETDPGSYLGFKPLPQNTKISDPGMEDIFKQFGLTEDNKRLPKAIASNKNKMNSFDAVPDQFKGILADIGLSQTDVKHHESKNEKQHVFNPINSQYANEDEVGRLNNLVTALKNLEQLNRTITDEDLKNVDLDELKELVGSLNVPLDQQKGLNPLDFGLNVQKNEVKRQELTTTTTEETVKIVNPSLEALEDSFGGNAEAEITPAPTEAPKKTGFYYLVDWNTFFDIDNQKGKRVNLRFQPTIGDPKRFLSVNVP